MKLQGKTSKRCQCVHHRGDKTKGPEGCQVLTRVVRQMQMKTTADPVRGGSTQAGTRLWARSIMGPRKERREGSSGLSTREAITETQCCKRQHPMPCQDRQQRWSQTDTGRFKTELNENRNRTRFAHSVTPVCNLRKEYTNQHKALYKNSTYVRTGTKYISLGCNCHWAGRQRERGVRIRTSRREDTH